MRSSFPWRRPIVAMLAALVVALALSSCSTAGWIAGGAAGGLALFPATRLNHLYNRTYHPGGSPEELATAPAHVRMAVVECDEHGWFRDRTQARAVLDSVQALSRRRNVAVVLYVHGWRHNAATRDGDVRSFRGTLQYLGEELQRDDLRRMRLAATGQETADVVGIYVGWRGKAWPEIPVTALNLINYPVYFTFWSRKAAAGRVGQGDLSEFVRELDALQRAINEPTRQGTRTVMSLVTIGHSFGGHALFDATRQAIEGHLVSAITGAASTLDAPVGSRLYDVPGALPDSCRRIVQGLGDLVVLINPAIEAASYRRIDQLVRQTRFRHDQTPVLVTVSARNDAARNTLFTLGRFVSHFGAPVQSRDQARMLGHALGSWSPQLTHHLALAADTPENRRRASRRVTDPRPPGTSGPAPEPASNAETQQSAQQLKGAIGAARQVGFLRLESRAPGFDGKPAYVIEADREVIDNHSDFFRVEFVRWLVDFMLATQKDRIERDIRRAQESAQP